MNVIIKIEYDGTNYAGWQIQPHKQTIQGELEKALSQIFQEPIKVVGASRTDAGVSAMGQMSNFHISNMKFRDLPTLQKSLNAVLPEDIYVRQIKKVNDSFHARYSAKGKIYQYRILINPSPLRQRFAWVVKYNLDLLKMRSAAKLFLRNKDFSIFCKVKDKDGQVKMDSIRIKKIGDEILISIEANRFLYKMVRRIVGALTDVGRRHRSLDDIKNSVKSIKHRTLMCAPAQGLILVQVKY